MFSESNKWNVNCHDEGLFVERFGEIRQSDTQTYILPYHNKITMRTVKFITFVNCPDILKSVQTRPNTAIVTRGVH